MSVSRPAVKAVPAALLSLSTLLALSISLLLTACGGRRRRNTTPATPTITSVTAVCSPSSIQGESNLNLHADGERDWKLQLIGYMVRQPYEHRHYQQCWRPYSVRYGDGNHHRNIYAGIRPKSGNATVTMSAPSTITSVSVVCSPASILTTQTSDLHGQPCRGTGSFSSAVTWGATDGTITPSGVFTPNSYGNGNDYRNIDTEHHKIRCRVDLWWQIHRLTMNGPG